LNNQFRNLVLNQATTKRCILLIVWAMDMVLDILKV